MKTTHKSSRIEKLLADCQGFQLPPHYLGYFKCFDAELYYEAHDVLEELWLNSQGGDYFFYKGLIQVAGAFVHLQKNRLKPAAALFRSSRRYLLPFQSRYFQFEVNKLLELCLSYQRLSELGEKNALLELGSPKISQWLKIS